MSIDFTAEGHGYFRVFVDEVAVSQHLTEREALERATELELEDSARDVYVERDYRIRVEAEASTSAPDPDPVPDPDPDPPADPEDPVDPPTDPVDPPPPTDPSGAFLRVDWDYAQLHDGSAGRYPTTYGPDNGHSRQALLAQPGPWGGDRALRNTFLPMPAYTQPQVGTRVDFPAPVSELWLETWLRFSPNWTVNPSFEQPPGTPISNWDHKTLFLFSMEPGADPWGSTRTRWDVKFGPNGDDCVASGAGSYYEVGHMPPQGGYNWDRYNQNFATRCSASALLWDNQWHQLRVHVRCGSSGLMECWLDGRKFIDSSLTPGLTDTPDSHRFWSVWFGGNRNSGPTEEMWFEVGPATFYDQDPGW